MSPQGHFFVPQSFDFLLCALRGSMKLMTDDIKFRHPYPSRLLISLVPRRWVKILPGDDKSQSDRKRTKSGSALTFIICSGAFERCGFEGSQTRAWFHKTAVGVLNHHPRAWAPRSSILGWAVILAPKLSTVWSSEGSLENPWLTGFHWATKRNQIREISSIHRENLLDYSLFLHL